MALHTSRARASLPPAARLIVVAALAVAASACDTFSPGHDTATIEIRSNPATTITVITSNEFAIGFDEDGVQIFHLFQADTTFVQTPFTGDYDLQETRMFYVRAAAAENPAAVVSLRARVDGREQFFHEAVLEGAGIQFYYSAR
jgi:hypothetical protein